MKKPKTISKRRSALSAVLSAALCLTAVFASGSMAALAGPAPRQVSPVEPESRSFSSDSVKEKRSRPAAAQSPEPNPPETAPGETPAVPDADQPSGGITELGQTLPPLEDVSVQDAPVPEPVPAPENPGVQNEEPLPSGESAVSGQVSQAPANRPDSTNGESVVSGKVDAQGTDTGEVSAGALYREYDRDLTLNEVMAEAGALTHSVVQETEPGYFYDVDPADLAYQSRTVEYDFDRRNTRALTVYADRQGEISVFFESRFPTALAGLRIVREATGAQVCSWRWPARSDRVYLVRDLEPGAAYRVELCSYYPGHYGITGTMLVY